MHHNNEAMTCASDEDGATPTSNKSTLRFRKSCQACRAAKLKCNGHQPQCDRCSKQGIKCTYVLAKSAGRPSRHAKLRTIPNKALASRDTLNGGFQELKLKVVATTQDQTWDEVAETTDVFESIEIVEPQQNPNLSSLLNLDENTFQLDSYLPTTHHDFYTFEQETVSGTDTDAMFLDETTYNTFLSKQWPTSKSYPSASFTWCPDSQLSLSLPPLTMDVPSPSAEASADYAESPDSCNDNISACSCLDIIIKLLLHRNQMREPAVSAGDAALRRNLEGLMRRGLSAQWRCNRCLEDPLVFMIWAKITSEYLTVV